MRNDVFLMEAYMYRCLPQTKLIAQLVRDGELGTVHQIQATFAFAVVVPAGEPDLRRRAGRRRHPRRRRLPGLDAPG